jgi:hypothetical protein
MKSFTPRQSPASTSSVRSAHDRPRVGAPTLLRANNRPRWRVRRGISLGLLRRVRLERLPSHDGGGGRNDRPHRTGCRCGHDVCV